MFIKVHLGVVTSAFLVVLRTDTQTGTTKMARRTKALTNTEVDKAKPRNNVYKLADGGGLQLRIKPNGSKA
jgi:hypothetical protein